MSAQGRGRVEFEKVHAAANQRSALFFKAGDKSSGTLPAQQFRRAL
jgi:hypothetical protein